MEENIIPPPSHTHTFYQIFDNLISTFFFLTVVEVLIEAHNEVK